MFNTRGTQKTPVFIKNCIFSYAFKLQSPSKHSFDAIDLLRHFFHCSKQFLNLQILMHFSASAIFCFTSSTQAQCFPLRIFFILGNKQKSSHGARLGEKGGQGTGAMASLSKTAEHEVQYEQVCSNHQSLNQKHSDSSKKKKNH